MESNSASIVHDDEDQRMWDEIMHPQGGPAIDPSILARRKIANGIPPIMPNVIWGSIVSSEPQTGVNFLHQFLVVHDAVPSLALAKKLMGMMKYGPSNASCNVYYKDPLKTDLLSAYVYNLVSASGRLVRRGDSGALFGPLSWRDIEELLSQSIDQTISVSSPQALAQGLQLAARGARLLSLMLTTELQGHSLFSTASPIEREALCSMPTVFFVVGYGSRRALKAAVRQVTKCLVVHSKWILDHGGSDTPFPVSVECCFLEASSCWDNLGSVLAVLSWLFCVEEQLEMKNPACALVIRDEFLGEMGRSLTELPEMNAQKKKKLVKNMTMYFVSNLCKERFATPMAIVLGKMIGVEDDLALWGVIPPLE